MWRITFLFVCFLSAVLPLTASSQNRYDVLITECLPDPSPRVGLPETSFIELTSHSERDIQLRNWKISNGSSSAVIKTDLLLKTGSSLILCPSSATAAFSLFGPAIGISGFPALGNEAGNIILINESGETIHAVHYEKKWFENEIKAGGGWSLEMIDLSNPCTGRKNWNASISAAGGTPGLKNSVDAFNPDEQPPSLLRSIATDSMHLILIFDEPVDSLHAANILNYTFSDGIGIPASVISLPPFFDRIEITLQKPMIAGKTYSVTVQNIFDVSLNEISMRNTCKAGLALKVKNGDIIFNEILFNPPLYGFDYLELYNRSSGIISCSELYIAGRDMSGSLKDPLALIKEARVFFPGEYLVLTENPDWILHNYPLTDAAQIFSVSSLPSMPDDMGKLVLLNTQGEIIDELDYDHHWHSPMLASETGVALERIRPDLPTSRAMNWTSAAADAGFGTPAYINSESMSENFQTGTDFISAVPKIFSPDMDGYQDFLFIHYRLPDAGFTGSISIYDVSGRMVRNLVNNNLWGTSGIFRWDGLDDQQNLLPMGHYIIYGELFRPDGTVIKKKLVCVLAR